MLMLKFDIMKPDGSMQEKVLELTAEEASSLISKLKAAQSVRLFVHDRCSNF
jgi:hypothetical protein